MKKLILTAVAGAAALSLAACDAREQEETTVVADEPTPAPLPPMTEETTVIDETGTTGTTDTTGTTGTTDTTGTTGTTDTTGTTTN
jgi:hypothetical protein